jgi:hypothetical protein
MKRTLFCLTLLALAPLAARADDKKDKDPPKSDLPVTAKLTAKTESYTLDSKADDLKKQLDDAKKSGKYPTPPKVDLALEITNTSDKDVEIWTSGDPVVLTLDLKGPGAVSVDPLKAFTDEFRVPKATTLAPGKSFTIPVKGLTYGFRGAASQAYWTEAGEYTLGATFQTGISPAPKGAKDVQDGFGKVSLTAEPVKIKVEAK